MAGGAPNMDQFELYFKRADVDQDGRVSGSEAVSFFQASGLPKPVLAQIWTIADQNRTGYLGRVEFYNYLKLVTVAQSKRDLTPDIVKAALYGPASAKIPAPQINIGALAAPQSNLNVGPPTPQMVGSGPAASQGIGIRGSQSYSPQQSQVMRSPHSPLPNTTFQSQHGVPGGGMMLTSRPSGSTLSVQPRPGVSSQLPGTPLDVFGLASSGSTLPAQPRPQGPTSLLQNAAPKPNGPNLSASVPGAKDSSSPVAGNGFASNSAFGDTFSAAPSQAKTNSVVTAPSASGLPVSPPNIPPSGGTQLPNKPSQPFHSNVSHPPTASQNQQMHSTFRPNQQVPVQNSSALPVRAENFPSSQSSQPWPKMSQSSVQKYTKVFMEVDTDKDGKITGEQARNLFLSWRLPREILKQVWDLSDQDNDSMLSQKEFCIALYLMERFREGRPLPKVLPASIFEGTPLPVSGQAPATYGAPLWRPPPGIPQAQGATVPRQVTPAAARPPRPVPVPIPETDEDMQPRQRKHTVPVLEKHLVDQLSTDEQKSLNSKFQDATEADKKVGELEKEILEAKQKIEFYRNKMQEIVLYKSRCDSRLNEITERVSTDKKEVESLSKKYEDKYKQAGDVASKLTIEEATFRDIQEKKMELYRAIVKLEQDGKPEDIQARADRIQADLEEQVKSLNERCKMYGLRGKPTSLVELPFGWQPGIQDGAADWDEHWDKFEDEGFTFVKELTLDVQNVIAPPKPKSLPLQNKSTFRDNGSTTVSASDANHKPEKLTVAEDKTPDNESTEQKKDSSGKTPPDSPASRNAAETPPKIFQDVSVEKNTGEDNSPHAIKTQSKHLDTQTGDKAFDEAGWGTFDTHYDSDANWDFNATKSKDIDQESKHENSFFDSSDGWGLNPIRTEVPKKAVFDSVPGTPAYSYAGSPPGDSLFQNRGPFSSAFADSVPSTPAYSYAGSPRGSFQQPFASVFADSVPSTPMFATDSPRRFSDGTEDHSFSNNFSRFDSFSSSTATHDGGLFPPRDSFGRFDSFRSTAQDSEYDQGFSQPQSVARFDSIRSSADSDFGHSLFQPQESFSRFDSMRSTTESSDFNHGFPSFDDADPFGSSDPFRSHDPFKTAVESETPRRDSVDGWKAF
ncbi:epidermal growth factor receptor substrate 15-like 1 [Cynara cardunculus var. scolymus]|uniref:Calcium-binding EF-hand n=1 Tax=Cynara cardunculus var. scolymus TaxID=59895 RepID=A0A103XCL1_CYNCS|nr:epidermal growth factor receptor substrate 15-like 1 [Cynara cardunculus var. scolymus]KVH88235.1 Calcium-binding EF-hand [Cynara cardunculus var. scolymus]